MSKKRRWLLSGLDAVKSLANQIDSDKIKEGVEAVEKIQSQLSLGECKEKIKDVLNRHKQVKVFIAGSKVLDFERNAIRSELMKLSNSAHHQVDFHGYSFEDFERSLSEEGRQIDYNRFIEEKADCVIFILDGQVGGITLKEFEVALNAFSQNKRPEIYVYCKKSFLHNVSPVLPKFFRQNERIRKYFEMDEEIEKIKQVINEHAQYYIEYNNIDDLQQKVAADFRKYQ